MKRHEVEDLLERYRAGTCSPSERRMVDAWFNAQLSGNKLLLAEQDWQTNKDFIYRRLTAQTGKQRLSPYWIAAASVLLFIAGWFIVQRLPDHAGPEVAMEQLMIAGNRATLSLSDGRAIELSAAQEGIIVGNGITYQDGETVVGPEELYYKLSTPPGGTYQVVLSDGTTVWLGAGSSLKYPAAFPGEERVVELSGEGYFVVSKNKDKPFKVIGGGQTIEVLGTEFNLTAYADDPEVQTTLVEGAVCVTIPAGTSVDLRPGMQSVAQGANIRTRSVDTEHFTSWRLGYLSFADASVAEMMKKISRWYDVEVVYEETPPKSLFTGEISLDLSLPQVLQGLSALDVRFRLEGRTLTIIGK